MNKAEQVVAIKFVVDQLWTCNPCTRSAVITALQRVDNSLELTPKNDISELVTKLLTPAG